MSEPYEKVHVSYDVLEMPLTLHCVRCNAVIARRDEIPSKRYPGTSVYGIVRAPNYREVQLDLNDGSTTYLPHCADCVKLPLDKEKALAVVKLTWEAEMRHMGRPESAIEEMKTARQNLQPKEEGGKDGR